MKKLLSVLITCSIILMMTACSGSGEGGGTQTPTPGPSSAKNSSAGGASTADKKGQGSDQTGSQTKAAAKAGETSQSKEEPSKAIWEIKFDPSTDTSGGHVFRTYMGMKIDSKLDLDMKAESPDPAGEYSGKLGLKTSVDLGDWDEFFKSVGAHEYDFDQDGQINDMKMTIVPYNKEKLDAFIQKQYSRPAPAQPDLEGELGGLLDQFVPSWKTTTAPNIKPPTITPVYMATGDDLKFTSGDTGVHWNFNMGSLLNFSASGDQNEAQGEIDVLNGAHHESSQGKAGNLPWSLVLGGEGDAIFTLYTNKPDTDTVFVGTWK